MGNAEMFTGDVGGKWQEMNESPQVNSIEEIYEFAVDLADDTDLAEILDEPLSGRPLADQYSPVFYQFASDYFEITGINISPESTFIVSGLFMDMQLEGYTLEDKERVLAYLQEWVELVFEE